MKTSVLYTVIDADWFQLSNLMTVAYSESKNDTGPSHKSTGWIHESREHLNISALSARRKKRKMYERSSGPSVCTFDVLHVNTNQPR